jgi:hypothetical protein
MLRYDALGQQVKQLEAERDALKARIDSVEAERDAAVTRADAAERARADAATVHPAAVAARVKLEREAGAILIGADGKPVDVSAMSDRAIRVAVVKRADGFDCDEQKKSDVYVEARYDAVVGRPNPLAGLVPAGAVRSDADDLPDPEAAQRAMIERTRNASKVK